MAQVYSEQEILAAHEGYQKALAELDFDTAIQFFTEDAQGGNTQFGVFPDRRNGIREFMSHNPDDHGYECVWRAVDGNMLRWKWCHWFPGERPNGERYDYTGYCEARYAGDGKFDWLYSFPDSATIKQILIDWEQDQGLPYVSAQYDFSNL